MGFFHSMTPIERAFSMFNLEDILAYSRFGKTPDRASLESLSFATEMALEQGATFASMEDLDPADPFNIRIMDVDKFITDNQVQQVTTSLIKEPSSQMFNADGLFSEEIFGRIGTVDRLLTLGYIELNTTIIAPAMFKAMEKLGGIYIDIMAGRLYARWNDDLKDFERIYGDPEDDESADTGFNFFLTHYPKIKFKLTNSLSRESKVSLLDKYRDISLYKRVLVMPAGLRDISNDDSGKLIQDDINKLYAGLLSYTDSIPAGVTSATYDGIRYNIQAKVVEIYEYIYNMMTGKRGFLQGSYAARKIAMGTRNVISSAPMISRSPNDPQALKPDETMVGIFQTMKACQPLVFYGIKNLLINSVFGEVGSSYTITAINTKTFKLEYIEITDDERQRWTSADGINGMINRFQNLDVRDKPLTVYDKNKKPYYLMLVYDDDTEISLFRTVDDLKALGFPVDKSKIRPMTWVEFFYIATNIAVEGKHAFITRYPVLGDGGCYPSKIHLMSTSPGRIVNLVDLNSPGETVRMFAEYPILGNSYLDTMVINPNRLTGLGGDYDGDTCSFNMVLTDDANRECAAYLASTKSLINVDKYLLTANTTDLINLSLHNYTWVPKK